MELSGLAEMEKGWQPTLSKAQFLLINKTECQFSAYKEGNSIMRPLTNKAIIGPQALTLVSSPWHQVDQYVVVPCCISSGSFQLVTLLPSLLGMVPGGGI